MSKVLVFSPDTIPSEKNLAAGPGIRSWEIARGLHKYGHEITLAVPDNCYKNEKNNEFQIVPWNLNQLNDLCKDQECVILPQGHPALSQQYVNTVDQSIPTVVDIFTPNFLENLNTFPSNKEGMAHFALILDCIVPLLKRGDFFICATEKQKYYYTGLLNVLGRINPLTCQQRMIDIVPLGVPDEKPKHTKNVLKGKIVKRDDLVLLWFGGIYMWYDAHTLIKAMKMVVKKVPNAKLIFMGAVHPRLHSPPDTFIKAKNESKKLGLLNKNILFTDWRPFDERASWFLESDLGIVTHKVHYETEFSIRTRTLDLIWGGLPVVSTEGDYLSTLIKKYKCGEVVKPENPEKLAKIIIDLLLDEKKRKKMSDNTKKLKNKFKWEKVIKPLDDFCKNPHLAKDRQYEYSRKILAQSINTFDQHKLIMGESRKTQDYKTYKPTSRSLIKEGFNTLRYQGFGEFTKKTYEYLFKKKS